MVIWKDSSLTNPDDSCHVHRTQRLRSKTAHLRKKTPAGSVSCHPFLVVSLPLWRYLKIGTQTSHAVGILGGSHGLEVLPNEFAVLLGQNPVSQCPCANLRLWFVRKYSRVFQTSSRKSKEKKEANSQQQTPKHWGCSLTGHSPCLCITTLVQHPFCPHGHMENQSQEITESSAKMTFKIHQNTI